MTNTTSTTPKPRRAARGEYAKTEARRKAILDAALEVFSESGYRSGSLREIAQRVGISEAGVLHHFTNKVALLEAVLDHRDDRSRELVPLEFDDGARMLRGLVRLAAYNASVPGVVELYCTLSAEATSPDHPAHGYFVRRYEYVRRNIQRAFGELEAEGRLRSGMTPTRAAVALIAMMDGLQVQWLLDRTVLDMAEELRALISAFVDIDWDVADEGLI
ncbi:HTH-type transcriptional regulator SrpR [Microbacterium oxydans]|uniref:HTH-type transcriptional regulator SrpR n=1 Tax=Microbacterium oxydans TaxID=82380 RepID=A0A0F0LE83_9MICO|nr:TetR/AcrR family transcriptional regulator [Microbacterium oxydans]KJL30600.1 HTH-type transcriptional regulator SrpR [Microbacterium oxydans]CAH0220369.1 HTH-type transcriptional regulator SrpR [Microbacterium oxydans]